MPRTKEELEEAAIEAESWLDNLDPDTLKAEDIADLRAIVVAVSHIADSEHQLANAVQSARSNGRSWSRIAIMLGVSKQAARQRFGTIKNPPSMIKM